jgi:hypothetical protein
LQHVPSALEKSRLSRELVLLLCGRHVTTAKAVIEVREDKKGRKG